MPREVLEKKPITIAEAMASLQQRSEESELSYWQRVAFEHAMHHARIEPQESREIVVKLTKDFGISELSAFTIANILPTTQEELKDLLQKDPAILSNAVAKKIFECIKPLVEKYSKDK